MKAAFALLAAAVPCLAMMQAPAGMEGHHLIQMDGEYSWVAPASVEGLLELGPEDHPAFMDLTSVQQYEPVVPQTVAYDYPDGPQYQDVVLPLFGDLTEAAGFEFLNPLTEFHNRYYTTNTGRDSALFIRDRVQDVIDEAGRSDFTVETWTHSFGIQDSVIARFEGAPGRDDVVIIGAHLDSVNSGNPVNGRAPGGNDDGSGSAAAFLAMRAMAFGDFRPTRPVEFHWYAAEEVGLRGSADMAAVYNSENRPVYGMIQLDMVGMDRTGVCSNSNMPAQAYRVVVNRPTGATYVNMSLTNFLIDVIEEYADSVIPIREDSAHGGTSSDHASWHRNGYPVCRTKEYPDQPSYHNDRDTIDCINWDYLLEFARITVGWTVELAYASGNVAASQ